MLWTSSVENYGNAAPKSIDENRTSRGEATFVCSDHIAGWEPLGKDASVSSRKIWLATNSSMPPMVPSHHLRNCLEGTPQTCKSGGFPTGKCAPDPLLQQIR